MAKHSHGTALAPGPGVWLEAILTKADLQTVLEQFSPLKIVLGDSGSLLLAEPKEVFLIPDEGVGIVCDATLHWPILGFDVPVSLRGLTVRVLPVIEQATNGKPLVFRLQIDHTGVALLPSVADHHVTSLVNDELQKKHIELSWKFIETLTHEFGLPASIASSAAISFVAIDGMVKANDAALGLAVRFKTTVRRRLNAAETAVAPRAVPVEEPVNGLTSTTNGVTHLAPERALHEAFDVRSFVVGSAVATVAFATVGGLVRLFRRDRHRSW
jgi:hypothetical protein